MLVPDLGQHGTARLSQCSPPFGFLRPAASAANRRFARLMFEASTQTHQSMTGGHPARAYREGRTHKANAARLGRCPSPPTVQTPVVGYCVSIFRLLSLAT